MQGVPRLLRKVMPSCLPYMAGLFLGVEPILVVFVCHLDLKNFYTFGLSAKININKKCKYMFNMPLRTAEVGILTISFTRSLVVEFHTTLL